MAAWKTGRRDLFRCENQEKGAALLAALSDLLSDADSDAVNAQKEETKKILAKLPLKELTTDGFGGDVMMEKFYAPEWKSLVRGMPRLRAPARLYALRASAMTLKISTPVTV